MTARKNSAGRVTIGLPERLDKAQEALRHFQSKIDRIENAISDPNADAETLRAHIQNILKGQDDG